MTKIDLITGFLGAGKTTFIREYVKHLTAMGMRVCILENDYGAVNVDTMFLKDLISDKVDMEMVAGGCDADCHKRRFKTKLITMGMKGYDRVIVEPSGLFDVDEFFDTLYEEPLDNWYEIGNVICLVEANLKIPLSDTLKTCLTSEIANAGLVVFTKSDIATTKQFDAVSSYINDALLEKKVNRCIEDFSITCNLTALTNNDFKKILEASYKRNDYVKFNVDDSNCTSCYFMNISLSLEELKTACFNLFNNSGYGVVYRVKGFLNENGWKMINATKDDIYISEIDDGQNVVIVIGENLNEEEINKIIY